MTGMKRVMLIACLLSLGVLSVTAKGLNLFDEGKRQAAGEQVVIMDFIERYFNKILEMDQPSAERMMRDDKVYFLQGSAWELNDSLSVIPCSINLLDGNYFISWYNQNCNIIQLRIPVQYGLIMGESIDQAQKRIKDRLMSMPDCGFIPRIPLDADSIAPNLYRSFFRKYEIRELSDACYFHKDGGRFIPIYSNNYLDYSIANLFLGQIEDADYTLRISQNLYENTVSRYDISLIQWLNYCKKENLDIYFGIEEERKESVLALIIAHSTAMEYNHMLSVDIKKDILNNPQSVLLVKLTPYIPTHNTKR